MATSGSASVTVTSYDTLQFSWSQSSQNVANNTTTISWSLKLIAGSYGAIYSSTSRSWGVTINGTSYSGSGTVAIGNNETRTLASGSTTISHNADGTKTFSYSFSQDFQITFSGSWVGMKSGSGSGVLNTIPRATTPSVSPTSVTMGNTVTISMPRASSSFTHDLAYSIAGSSYISIATGQGASYIWTVPDLSSYLTQAEGGTVTIRCITKNGSATIGTKTCSLTVIVPTSYVPTIDTVSATEATQGIAAQFGAFVQSKSTLSVSIHAYGTGSAWMTGWTASFDGKSYMGNFGTGNIGTFTTSEISSSGNITLTVRVIDSRGRVTTTTKTITILPYFAPKINSFSAWRIDTSGNDDDEGTRIAMTMNFEIAEVGTKNNRTYNFKYKKSSDADFTSFGSGTASWTYNDTQRFTTTPILSTDSAYVFRLEISDYFQTVSYEFEVPTAFTLMDFRSTGKGMAIGKVSEKDEFEIAMDADFQAGIKLDGVSIVDHVIEEGTSGIWTYRKWSSGKLELWGAESKGTVSLTLYLGVYYASLSLTFPSILISADHAFIMNQSNGFTTGNISQITNSYVAYRLISLTQNNPIITLHAYVIGKWK